MNYTDIKAYLSHIQTLEIINILIYVVIIIVPTIITFFITKIFLNTFIVFLTCTAAGYLIYAINQLRADQHKLQIDIYIKLLEIENNKN